MDIWGFLEFHAYQNVSSSGDTAASTSVLGLSYSCSRSFFISLLGRLLITRPLFWCGGVSVVLICVHKNHQDKGNIFLWLVSCYILHSYYIFLSYYSNTII